MKVEDKLRKLEERVAELELIVWQFKYNIPSNIHQFNRPHSDIKTGEFFNDRNPSTAL